jgi:glutaredoxin
VGFLNQVSVPSPAAAPTTARVQVALREGCAWSRRTERLLQGLGIPYELVAPAPGALPQIWIDGQAIGGYPELAALQTRGDLQSLRHG